MEDFNPNSPSSFDLKQSGFYNRIRQIADIFNPQNVLVVAKTPAKLAKIFSDVGITVTSIEIPGQDIPVQPHALKDDDNDPTKNDTFRYDLTLVCLDDLVCQSPPKQTEELLVGLCQHSGKVLIVSEIGEAKNSDFSPGQHAKVMAKCRFFRDFSFEVSDASIWAALYHHPGSETPEEIILAYENRLWEVEQANFALREKNLKQQELLTTANQKLATWETRWALVEGSASWRVAEKLQQWRLRFAPPGSVRDQLLEDLFGSVRTGNAKLFATALSRLGREAYWKIKLLLWQAWLRLKPPATGRIIRIAEIPPRSPIKSHQTEVDVVICVHNALPDVRRCLQSVEDCTAPPYSLILVDDGSDSPAQSYLAECAKAHRTRLVRNEEALGYTKAANQGLRLASAEYVVLLNSDTVVTEGWLDRLIACAESNPKFGMIGPLSNTASWQSIPKIKEGDDWADNLLPGDLTVPGMGELVARFSGRLYPTMPFLNGFCLMVRQQLVREIGYFDEETFGAGYGEENDYALRARQAGWQLGLADDTYIYHAQSRSYSRDRRKYLSERAGIMLAQKHGARIIQQGTDFCRSDRVLRGIRARSQVMLERQEWLKTGKERFAGRRLLFLLPIVGASGGGHVVIDEAKAMREMGVEVTIFNLIANKQSFERGYPDLDLPVIYGEKNDLISLARRYDAISATTNTSVEWLVPLVKEKNGPILGYYVQEFEPYIYPPGSADFKKAWASYTLLPELNCYTKTEWTRQEVKQHTGVDSQVVGISLNIDRFRPRPRPEPEGPARPLKIVAMVRPRSPHRQAKLTMEILRRAAGHYGTKIEITIFGVTLEDPRFANLPRDFTWNLAGILSQRQVATLLDEADIFVDFSSHQAMGLTALEAMACGCAVIVPARGGAASFARHQQNSLVADTSSLEACWQALQCLIDNQTLRSRLQNEALADVCQYYPEQPAYNILNSIFDRVGNID